MELQTKANHFADGKTARTEGEAKDDDDFVRSGL